MRASSPGDMAGLVASATTIAPAAAGEKHAPASMHVLAGNIDVT